MTKKLTQKSCCPEFTLCADLTEYGNLFKQEDFYFEMLLPLTTRVLAVLPAARPLTAANSPAGGRGRARWRAGGWREAG